MPGKLQVTAHWKTHKGLKLAYLKVKTITLSVTAHWKTHKGLKQMNLTNQQDYDRHVTAHWKTHKGLKPTNGAVGISSGSHSALENP